MYRWLSMAEPGARLFRAKYVYRPLRDSPNDNPETELSLTPGDYLLIFGDLDEDFYYRGELWTGERGLVPSNYVEPVTGGVLGIDTATPIDPSTSLLMIDHQRATSSVRHLNRAASERVPSGIGPGGVGRPLTSVVALSALRSARSVDAFGVDMQQLDSMPAVLSSLSALSTWFRRFHSSKNLISRHSTPITITTIRCCVIPLVQFFSARYSASPRYVIRREFKFYDCGNLLRIYPTFSSNQ